MNEGTPTQKDHLMPNAYIIKKHFADEWMSEWVSEWVNEWGTA